MAALLRLLEQLAAPQDPPAVLALARDAVSLYRGLADTDKVDVLRDVAEHFGADRTQLEAAINAWRKDDAAALPALRAASETRRQRMIRRLNLAPEGTEFLIEMRADVLRNLKTSPVLAALDADLLHVFEYWFSAGFLTFRSLEWSSSADLLSKLIDYEAVHAINGWEDLRRRVEPADRRCYAFFHPSLPDTPLIFVEIALTKTVPGAISELLSDERAPIGAGQAATAVFYSISNCQTGLRGIPFGNFLIKRVMEVMAAELPQLKTFVTLSPVPQFAAWLKRARLEEPSPVADLESRLRLLDEPDWAERLEARETLRPALLAAGARYFLQHGQDGDRLIDPVARFHLGNGARLEALRFLGDGSAKGLSQSHGLMVNYLYNSSEIDRNHRLFHSGQGFAVSPAISRLAGREARPTKRFKKIDLSSLSA